MFWPTCVALADNMFWTTFVAYYQPIDQPMSLIFPVDPDITKVLRGAMLVVDRGKCPFTHKAKLAQVRLIWDGWKSKYLDL